MSPISARAQAAPLHQKPWLALALGFKDFSYRQSPAYVESAAASAQAKTEYMEIRTGQGLLGLSAVRVKKLPMLPIGVAYIHHGPITTRDPEFSPRAYSVCLEALIEYYVVKRGLVLRVVPPDIASLPTDTISPVFEQLGFKKLDRASRQTFTIDLGKPLVDLRKGLESRWRNKLNQAEKLSEIRIVDTRNSDQFSILAAMLQDLERKKDFEAAQDVDFFTKVQKQSESAEELKLYVGYHQDRPVSAHLCSITGDTIVSLLAATNDEGRDLKISHRMQWRVIEDGQSLGKRWYDTGGVDAEANPGVYTFKKGMNGVAFTEPGVFDYAPSGGLASLVGVAERIYRKIRRRGYRK